MKIRIPLKRKTKSQIKTVNCLYCNKQFTIKVSAAGNGYSTSGKFCNRKCCGLYTAQHITINKVKKGEIASSTTLRKALIHLYGNKCGECGSLPLWNGKPLVLQLHHKDGDACNNVITNLQLLCPNCHSQTNTYCGKNINKKRPCDNGH